VVIIESGLRVFECTEKQKVVRLSALYVEISKK
jgi:hypothetical protein